MSKILLFDAAPTGHHGEFLENMIYGISRTFSGDCRVLTHPDLRLRLEAAKVDSGSEIRLSYLGTAQLDSLNGANSLFERGRLELNIVEEACINHGVHKVLIMHMNIHQYALRTGLRIKGISVRGILLNPYTPLRRAHTWKQKALAGITSLRKRLQFRLMFCNPQIDRVFLLNDARVAEELNRSYLKRRPFSSTTDPIPAVSARMPTVTSLFENKGKKRHNFLLIGSMAPRKGCLMVLKAMQQMAVDELSQIRLRLVGKFGVEEVDYRSDVLSAIQDLHSKCPNVYIGVEDRHVDFSEMNAELLAADCVLVPYIGFYGSSGILGHACRAGKPVISCDEGLIGELVRELELGLTVNPKDLEALCGCLRIALTGKLPFNLEAARKYVKDADYKNFSNTLIADWNE
jgi:glycosyltransferase involved in cell wall biosynthesis